MDPQMQRLFEGLPTFAAPRSMLSRFEALASQCGDRPLFALVFADQPHFPYVQTWPHYLAKGESYTGRFKFGKDDATRGVSSEQDKARIRELYDTSLLSTDDAFARLVAHLLTTGQLEKSTVILTGDHGESLYDSLDIVGHGDQIGEMEGISVPWVVFGVGKKTFATKRKLVQSTELASQLASINGLKYAGTQGLPEGVIYVETDLWMAHTPNVPRHRVRYPELSGLLTLEDKEAHIEVDRAFLPTIEFAKHRLWVVDGKRYTLEPGEGEIRATIDGQRATTREFPDVIRGFMHRYYPDVAPALVP
jgi:arylsulfatase A-like enzyme